MSRRILGSTSHNGVCVIGAGVSGIVATRYLSRDGMDVFTIEAKDNIGGTWYSVDNKGGEDSTLKKMYGCYLPEIYDGLNTNIEQSCMTLKDMPYDKNHTIVPGLTYLQYLHEYVDKFDLLKYMLFEHIIVSLRLVSNLTREEIEDYGVTEQESQFRYIIIYERNRKGAEMNSMTEQHYIFCDYVVSCNGLYNTPFVPQTRGSELFTGEQIHTHSYVTMSYLREKLSGKRVIVVGSNQSGRDIVSHSLCGFAGQPPIDVVHITHCVGSDAHLKATEVAKEAHPELSTKLTVIKGRLAEFMDGNKAIVGGKEIDVDIVVWATGYTFSFPFLSAKDDIIKVEQSETGGRLIQPLYLMTFSINHPTFSRPLVPYKYKAELLLNVERQIMMISAVYSGKAKLPPKTEMSNESQAHIQRLRDNGYDLTWFHKEVADINTQNDLLQKWFELSGCEQRDTNLDKLMDELNSMKLKALFNGDFYHYPKKSHFNVEYTDRITSDRF